MRLATASEMREMDRATIKDYGLPGMVLMENAGRAVAEAVRDLIGNGEARVVIIAGKGNNGGDGFVAARHLSTMGVEVVVLLLAKAKELKGDAAANCEYARKIGLDIIEEPEDEIITNFLDLADVAVDAILGTGISGEVRGRAREVIELMEACEAPIVAVDIPSGLDTDNGQVLGAAVEADVTVTFGLAKPGLVQYPGKSHVGELRVVDIGLPPAVMTDPEVKTHLTEAADVATRLPHRPADAHKGTAGRVLVVAGSTGFTGAATLCSDGAARIGAGLVTLAIPAPLNDILETKLTEVMTVPVPAAEVEGAAVFSLQALAALIKWSEKVDAVALGPGLSTKDEVPELVADLLPKITKPLVLDADGLNALTGDTEPLRSRVYPTVITPHPGELSRLMDMEIDDIQADRLGVARQAATELDCIVVLKGAATVIAEPGGEAWINSTGNPGMASGGMGDVLTGAIAGLLAGSTEPFWAAIAGVYLHALAGDLAAEQLGPRGLLASDLLARLPEAYRQLWG